jgi:putative membrane protein
MGFGVGSMFGGGSMIVVWVLIIVGIIYAVTWYRGSPRGSELGPIGEAPMDILRKRYAKGEITKEKFDRVKQDLTGWRKP